MAQETLSVPPVGDEQWHSDMTLDELYRSHEILRTSSFGSSCLTQHLFAWPYAFGDTEQARRALGDTEYIIKRPPGNEEDAELSTPFTRADVEHIIASVNGCRDWMDWILVGQLRDGRYIVVKALCDYTGFSCRGGTNLYAARQLEEVVRFALTTQDMERLTGEGDGPTCPNCQDPKNE